MEPEKAPKIRPWQKISLMLAGLLLALLILELYARATQRFIIPVECFRSDEVLNHSYVPNKTCRFKTSEWNNYYKINSLGFRDKPRTVEKSPNTFRILMLGDSFTEGWGVNQNKTFSNLLEEKLNHNNKKRYEVINAGISGYSPILEYLQLKTVGLTLEPDLVILNFDYSDFSEEIDYSKLAKYNSDNLPTAVTSTTAQHLQRVIDKLIEINRDGAYIENLKKQPLVYFLAKNFYITRIFSSEKDVQTQLSEDLAEPQESDLELPEKYLKTIRDLTTEKNIKFMVTLYPYRDHLFGQKHTAYFSKLTEFGQNNNIQIANFLPTFQKNKSENLYFKHDFHGTKKFHMLMASSIYDYLTGHNLLAK